MMEQFSDKLDHPKPIIGTINIEWTADGVKITRSDKPNAKVLLLKVGDICRITLTDSEEVN
jgi:hypothetical protein